LGMKNFQVQERVCTPWVRQKVRVATYNDHYLNFATASRQPIQKITKLPIRVWPHRF
jgi:hypothetical protein